MLNICLAATCVSALAVSFTTPQGDDSAWQAQESRHVRNIRQLTFDAEGERGFERAGEAYFSPDAHTIIFQAVRGRNPFYQIFTQPLAAGAPRMVSTGRGRTTCAFFRPDGKMIIFASSHLDPQVDATEEAERKRIAEESSDPSKRRRRYEWVFDEHMEIFEADPDGSNLKRLTDAAGYDAEGSYSPDGRQIVFCSTRDGDPDLYIMNADGSGVRQLTDAPGYDGGPFFSPDGQRVIFRSDRKEKDLLQLYVINADGSGERALTDNSGVNWCPYWHPDGRHVVYAFADYSNPNARPNFDLYLLNVDTGKTQRITFSPAADVLPVFSPDGKRLMWTSARRSGTKDSQIFIADFALEPAAGTSARPR
jgi:Tol biopolymer transport system component